MRGLRGFAAWVLLPLVLGGCGAGGAGQLKASEDGVPGAVHTMPDGTVMKDSEMGSTATMPSRQAPHGPHPSSAARMICSPEIAEAVKKNLALATTPHGLDSWSHQLYRCDYHVGPAFLRLSVKDLSHAAAGRAWYDRLRRQLSPGTRITGMENFGFPAFETPTGDVVFLKDHKTLWVDASHLSERDLPQGFTATDVAYGVAAAVVACWME